MLGEPRVNLSTGQDLVTLERQRAKHGVGRPKQGSKPGMQAIREFVIKQAEHVAALRLTRLNAPKQAGISPVARQTISSWRSYRSRLQGTASLP